MKDTSRLLSAIFLLCSISVADTPKGQVDLLLKSIREVNDPDKTAEATKNANSVLDIAGLARRSLGSQWNKLDENAQQNYVSLLVRIFELRVYPKSAEFFKGLEAAIGQEEIDDDKALVNTSLTHHKEGRVDIAYKLRKQDDGGWKIYEVEMDEVPMGANLRSQIRKVLKKDGYKVLVTNLQDKIKEFEAELKKK